MCDLLEKTIDFGHRMRFLKYLRAKIGRAMAKFKRYEFVVFARLVLLWVGLRFLCHFGRFLQKIQKGLAAVVQSKCFKNEKTREKTRQKKRERLKNKNVAKK